MAPRSLRNDPKRRKARIKELLKRLKNGQHVQNRDIGAVLDKVQVKAFERDLDNASSEAGPQIPYPKALDSYAKLLKEADLARARAARLRGNEEAKRSGTTKALFATAENLYERLNEHLSELLEDKGNRAAIAYWLDRPLQYGETGVVEAGDLDCTGAYRIRGSKSQYARSQPLNEQTVHELRAAIKTQYLMTTLHSLRPPKKLAAKAKKSIAQAKELLRLVRR